MKIYLLITLSLLSSCMSFSQETFKETQKKIVLEVIEAIIANDSSKFYSIVDTPRNTRHQIVSDFEFLNKRFQHLKSQPSTDSIKHYVEPNSIWEWNYKTRIFISNSKWEYIDLKFMFSSVLSKRIFHFSREVQFIDEPLKKAPG